MDFWVGKDEKKPVLCGVTSEETSYRASLLSVSIGVTLR